MSVTNKRSRSASSTGYVRWFKELKALAKKHGVSDWISMNDTKGWREWYDDDYTPTETLSEIYMEMCASA